MVKPTIDGFERAHHAIVAAMRGFSLIASLLSILIAPLASAAWATEAVFPDSSALTAGQEAMVTQVIDGDTLVLDDGGSVRLVGIQAPKIPLGREGVAPWPLGDQAKAALADLARGARVRLYYGGRRVDRYRRRLAHVRRGDGLWLQGEMLRRGLARVYSFADNRAVVPDMLALERDARAHRRGIWDHPYYRVRDHREAPNFIGSFQLVEGLVRKVAEVRGRTYINFGDDWRQDFTIVIQGGALKRFESFDPISLTDRRVRVRGWVQRWNGPMIEASHSGQIELLLNAAATSGKQEGTE
ncbi:MAG: thermonuclease family protein [Sphingomonadales bacterium]